MENNAAANFMWNAWSMKRLLSRYRDYLREKMAGTDPGADRIIEMQRQSAPWTVPMLIAGIICWTCDLAGNETLWITVPSGTITIGGFGFIGWIFVVEGTRLDLKRVEDKKRA
jgi:hypothetical protein